MSRVTRREEKKTSTENRGSFITGKVLFVIFVIFVIFVSFMPFVPFVTSMLFS